MCRRVDCPTCNKPTYAGCGAHIEQVLSGVAVEQRCKCREQKAKGSTVSTQPKSEPSWLSKFLGK